MLPQERAASQSALAEWVEAARGGDRDAFGLLVAALWPELVAFARSLLGRSGDAEDVVQDALVAAWRGVATLRAADRFSSWVWKMVYRGALQHLKGALRLAPIEEAAGEGIHLVTNDVDIPRLLAVLTPQQRAVIHLTYVEGMTNSEIRAALGVSAVSVRIYRTRAIARLRRHLGVELP